MNFRYSVLSFPRVKHDRIHLHMSSHLLFANGLRLFSVLASSKWDDEEFCVQLGPLQFSLHWIAECVNTLRVVSLFIVTRSHRPLGLMLRLTSAFYCK
ncbi:hypothetical protein FBUS_06659 [Fasciolopsis buskii]|uniref:Uncharacterized protein n=1 Tax=Fasciolopsis buskii TaxID=27845 RepID=A0A8E0S2T4_9TREM|nr:hypothetical protein FBUS_06659 [Fasciolopsis buski]